jgi:predicted naringenin-chalcone synthase
MFITGVGTATPPRRFRQTECWESLATSALLPTLSERSQALVRKVLQGDNGICTRFLGVDDLNEAFCLDPDVLDARFAKHAPAVATSAAERAMADAGLKAADIDALVISTCTGYLCPGLTSYVSERLGVRGDALALDLVGQGCGAALPNLRTGEALIASNRCGHVLSICVEICSAALYVDDDPGVLISGCLFGDGAGAAVLSNAPRPRTRRVEWKRGGTLLRPKDREDLRFERRGGMLRNILSPQVPYLAAEHVETVLMQLLDEDQLTKDNIASWIFHSGGREVMFAIRYRLGLDEDALKHSASVLRDYGNVSSSCVYFVLERTLRDAAPAGLWYMSSFGAGFSCHGALLEVGG